MAVTVDKSTGKGTWIYTAPYSKYLTINALRYGSHSFTCKLHRKRSSDGATTDLVAYI